MTIAVFIFLWIVTGLVVGSIVGNIIAQNGPLDEDDINN